MMRRDFSNGSFLSVAQANLNHALKSLNHGKQTKWNQLGEKVPICRGSLAWLGRQTHNLGKQANQMRNLEISGAKRSIPEVAGSNPAPGTNHFLLHRFLCWFSVTKLR